MPVDLSVRAPSAASPPPAPDPHASMPETGPYAGHLHFDRTVRPVLRTGFDVDAYVHRGSARLEVDTALLASQEPLSGDLRLALGVLQRWESSALAESRAMLATATGDEARITAFLATWLVDRFWQSRALRDVLTGDHPVDRPRPHHSLHPLRALRRVHVDRLQPLLTPLWNGLAGEAVAAGHMARMAIQEASLQAALAAVSRRLPGEARRVVDTVSARHDAAVDFFTAEAIARITRSRREAVTARVLLSLDSPLDGGGIVDPDLRPALAVLGATAEDRAALRRARYEITRLLPGPDLPDPYLGSLPRTGE
ncbi:hypothetical protein ACT3SP_09245 [Brachybacterium sp. AOP43-C2-M15]|uniref:hypothetical protein n=1 Tax=Brachybacterium sp. AOP43-C2-M15 TaxID=3457661 RepID=UPI0040339261